MKVAYSITKGYVSSSIILSKLSQKSRHNVIARALQEIGRIEKTLYLQQYFTDENLRRRVLVGLNKGEAMNGLARVLLKADKCGFESLRDKPKPGAPQKLSENQLDEIEYIRATPIDAGKKFAIIVDNVPWHKKAIRLIEDEKSPEYADIREKVVFIKLPPYSPDLNPIEQVWRITRRENTHNVFFNGKAGLEAKVDEAFAKWAKPNEQLRGLCSFKRED